jgi:hypothetical protein
MKQSLKRGASKVVAADPAKAETPARSWSQRDYPPPANPRKPKAEARTSMHFRVLSRTGGK